jgi:hypothetical protein
MCFLLSGASQREKILKPLKKRIKRKKKISFFFFFRQLLFLRRRDILYKNSAILNA